MDVKELIEALKVVRERQQQSEVDGRVVKAVERSAAAHEYLAQEVGRLNNTLQQIRMEGIRLQK